MENYLTGGVSWRGESHSHPFLSLFSFLVLRDAVCGSTTPSRFGICRLKQIPKVACGFMTVKKKKCSLAQWHTPKSPAKLCPHRTLYTHLWIFTDIQVASVVLSPSADRANFFMSSTSQLRSSHSAMFFEEWMGDTGAGSRQWLSFSADKWLIKPQNVTKESEPMANKNSQYKESTHYVISALSHADLSQADLCR